MDMNCFTQGFPGDIFWYDESLPAVKRSAFEPFIDTPKSAFDHNHNPIHGPNNMNKRVIGFLRRINATANTQSQCRNETEHEKERCFRHMMNERMRREKQKQSYSALHNLLPMGTKNDKNTIVHIAATKIRQLQSCRERLRRRKAELEAALAEQKSCCEEGKWTKVKVRVANPTSGVESMIEVLNFMKRSGLKTKNIRSVFAEEEFSAKIEIEIEKTTVKATEIEEAMQLTLHGVELNLRSHS